jgi:hypothetical protein
MWCVLSRPAGQANIAAALLGMWESARQRRIPTYSKGPNERAALADRPLYRSGGKNFCSRVCGASGRNCQREEMGSKVMSNWVMFAIYHPRQKFAWGKDFHSIADHTLGTLWRAQRTSTHVSVYFAYTKLASLIPYSKEHVLRKFAAMTYLIR